MGYAINLEQKTLDNQNFREVLFTTKNCQLVVMSLLAGEDIGEEVHTLDQFIRVESGTGKAIMDGVETEISDGWAVVVPAGARHNIVNTGDQSLKLYTIYAPAEHRDGTIHATKADAMADENDHYEML